MNKESLAEQIQQAAKEKYPFEKLQHNVRIGFINGAKWMQRQLAAAVEEEAARLAAEVSALREEVAELRGVNDDLI